MIEKIASLVPKDLLDRSGAVFYSGRNAFRGERPIYLLGVNPGGDPDEMATETLRSHMEKVLGAASGNWSAYRDESWGGAAPGTWRMQPRVLHLLGRLKLDPSDVPASNIAFLRSRRESNFQGDFSAIAEACWPFHNAVIEALNVRVVVCFGKSAGNWVRAKLSAHSPIGHFIEKNSRRWKSAAFSGSQNRAVVVVTHPSIADWTVSETDPFELVHEALTRSQPG